MCGSFSAVGQYRQYSSTTLKRSQRWKWSPVNFSPGEFLGWMSSMVGERRTWWGSEEMNEWVISRRSSEGSRPSPSHWLTGIRLWWLHPASRLLLHHGVYSHTGAIKGSACYWSTNQGPSWSRLKVTLVNKQTATLKQHFCAPKSEFCHCLASPGWPNLFCPDMTEEHTLMGRSGVHSKFMKMW